MLLRRDILRENAKLKNEYTILEGKHKVLESLLEELCVKTEMLIKCTDVCPNHGGLDMAVFEAKAALRKARGE